MVKKRVDIVVTMVNRLTGVARQIETSTKKLRDGVQKTTNTYDKFGNLIAEKTKFTREKENLTRFAKKFNGLGSVMGMSLQEFRKFDDGTGRLNKRMMKQVGTMGRLGLRVRHLTHGFRGFKMELLGVMFFGMGVQKFFTGLIKPALQAVGLFKLWASILTILFLPVALKLLDWTIKFMEWLNKSEAMQKFIRWVTIIGAVLGGVLFFIGMFGLGIGSMIIAFGAVITPILLAVGAFFGFITSMVKSKVGILAMIAAFIGLAPTVKATGDEVKAQGGIWSMITGWISTAVGKIISKVDEMWERFLDWGPITRFIEGMGLGVDAIEKLKNPIATIGNFFSTMWDKFLKKNPEVITKLGELGLQADEILKPWENIGPIITAVLETISEKIKELISGAILQLQESDIAKPFTDFITKLEEDIFPILETLFEKLKSIYEFAQKVGIIKALKFFAGAATVASRPSLAQEHGARRVIEESTRREPTEPSPDDLFRTPFEPVIKVIIENNTDAIVRVTPNSI